MEGRVGPSVKTITGGGRSGRRSRGKSIPDLRETLATAGTRAVAEAAVSVLAASDPAIEAAYLAYKAAEFSYPIVKAGVEESRRSGDTNKVVEKMAQQTAVQTGRAVLGATTDAIAGAAVDGTTKNLNIKATEPAKKVVEAAISEVMDEVIERYG